TLRGGERPAVSLSGHGVERAVSTLSRPAVRADAGGPGRTRRPDRRARGARPRLTGGTSQRRAHAPVRRTPHRADAPPGEDHPRRAAAGSRRARRRGGDTGLRHAALPHAGTLARTTARAATRRHLGRGEGERRRRRTLAPSLRP